ncbi:hypothetical protein Agabi119p4_3932 [Agaricus bisporus var. burnettii]|uniref:Uncharacterized protein n=1 Tax=Agaricus bisporus var. burnettii TaxID=192524 RepID=A0A8H7F5Q7_AGABI|nr:hypothetical protein Agabi119p4_3932 [Agaricus bisporus var. burnettii]
MPHYGRRLIPFRTDMFIVIIRRIANLQSIPFPVCPLSAETLFMVKCYPFHGLHGPMSYNYGMIRSKTLHI